jgi:hypothetical protein
VAIFLELHNIFCHTVTSYVDAFDLFVARYNFAKTYELIPLNDFES